MASASASALPEAAAIEADSSSAIRAGAVLRRGEPVEMVSVVTQVIDDSRQFVRCRGHCRRRSQPGPHVAMVIAQMGLVVSQRLRRHAQRHGQTVFHLPPRSAFDHLAARDVIVGTKMPLCRSSRSD